MKRIKFYLMAVAFLTLITSSIIHVPVQAQATNLVTNPSVESNSNGQLTDWLTDFWGNTQASFAYQNTGYNSNHSLSVNITKAGTGDAKWTMKYVAIQPNTAYTFSDFYKSTENSKVVLAYLDANGNDSYDDLLTAGPSSNWKQLTGSFTSPANVSAVAVWHLIEGVGTLQTDAYSLVGPAGGNPVPTGSNVVKASPATYTPQIPNGGSNAVYAYAQVGDTMYTGGNFASLSGTARTNLGAFSATTGKLASWAPQVNGDVWALAALPNNQIAIGGEFTQVNGVARKGLAVVDGTTGALVTGFNANLNGAVYDAKLLNGRLIIGGSFSKELMAVNPTTGADTGYLNLGISGVRVHRFSVNPQGTQLVAIGKFASVSGQTRRQAFMVNLGASSGTLSTWYYQPLLKYCSIPEDAAYIRGVSFSPDGSFFVLDGTGYTSNDGDLGSTICDAAARFESNIMAPSKPTWINYTGGDSLYSVAISNTAVYIGGHERWANNPDGSDTCSSPICVPRPGIGALDPATGVALSWNPMRTRGVGAQILYLTPAGLWVGSDTAFGGVLGCANPGGANHDDCTGKPLETHQGIGFLPY